MESKIFHSITTIRPRLLKGAISTLQNIVGLLNEASIEITHWSVYSKSRDLQGTWKHGMFPMIILSHEYPLLFGNWSPWPKSLNANGRHPSHTQTIISSQWHSLRLPKTLPAINWLNLSHSPNINFQPCKASESIEKSIISDYIWQYRLDKNHQTNYILDTFIINIKIAFWYSP